jgi:hypothetical protein
MKKMSLILLRSLAVGCATFVLGASIAGAQAPAFIAGTAFYAATTGGDGTGFLSVGSFLFLPADSGNGWQRIGLADPYDDTGTYSYSSSGAVGMTVLNDGYHGDFDASFHFLTPESGTVSLADPPAWQSDNFVTFTNPVLTSIVGQAFYISVTEGGLPYASSGSFVLTTSASGNTYSITHIGSNRTDSSGSYTYSRLNASCGAIALRDSLTGAGTVYFCLSNSMAGFYALKQPSNSVLLRGYQIGALNLLPTIHFGWSGNKLVIRWSTNSVGFNLESSPSMSTTSVWLPAAPPSISGTDYVVTNPVSAAAMFYRLKQ